MDTTILVITHLAAAVVGGAIIWKYKNAIIADIEAEKARVEAARNTLEADKVKAGIALAAVKAKAEADLAAVKRFSVEAVTAAKAKTTELDKLAAEAKTL